MRSFLIWESKLEINFMVPSQFFFTTQRLTLVNVLGSMKPCLVDDSWEHPNSSPASIWKPSEISFYASTQLHSEAGLKMTG